MPLVAIPAKLQQQINLHEGDLMEAAVIEDGIILLRPKDGEHSNAADDRVAPILAHTESSPDDADRSKDELMQDTLANMAEARRGRCHPQT